MKFVPNCCEFRWTEYISRSNERSPFSGTQSSTALACAFSLCSSVFGVATGRGAVQDCSLTEAAYDFRFRTSLEPAILTAARAKLDKNEYHWQILTDELLTIVLTLAKRNPQVPRHCRESAEDHKAHVVKLTGARITSKLMEVSWKMNSQITRRDLQVTTMKYNIPRDA